MPAGPEARETPRSTWLALLALGAAALVATLWVVLLLRQVRPGPLPFLVIPVLLAGVPLLLRRTAAAAPAYAASALLLLVFTLVFGLAFGLTFLPAALFMLLAAVAYLRERQLLQVTPRGLAAAAFGLTCLGGVLTWLVARAVAGQVGAQPRVAQLLVATLAPVAVTGAAATLARGPWRAAACFLGAGLVMLLAVLASRPLIVLVLLDIPAVVLLLLAGLFPPPPTPAGTDQP